jgi:hypothetical protein
MVGGTRKPLAMFWLWDGKGLHDPQGRAVTPENKPKKSCQHTE